MRHSRFVFCPLGWHCSSGVFVSSFPEVHARAHRLHQLPSERECRERPKSPHAAGLGTCPPTLAQTLLLTLAGGKSRRSAILLAQRRIMSSIKIGTIPAFGVPLCSESVFFFAHCPNSSSSVQRVDVLNLF